MKINISKARWNEAFFIQAPAVKWGPNFHTNLKKNNFMRNKNVNEPQNQQSCRGVVSGSYVVCSAEFKN